MVDQNIASWNQLPPWLRRVDTLRGQLGWPLEKWHGHPTGVGMHELAMTEHWGGAARRSRRPAVGESVHPTSSGHNLSLAYYGVNPGTVLGQL
jgi:hypothetical protein